MSSREKFIHNLITDKKAFDSFVYTPWPEAIKELENRQSDESLQVHIEKTLIHGTPSVMQGKKNIVLFRHVATPNYEINRFMACADSFSDYQALILEYTADKFNNRSEGKYFLGKLRFHKGYGKDNKPIYENTTIINFNESSNKPLSIISTNWGQLLVDFHHELFTKRFTKYPESFYDISNWLHLYGATAKEYYKPFLTLFLRDAILFENFFVNNKELSFTETVILPAFIEIMEESGIKPLIVTLAPTDVEADEFWHSHPFSTKQIIAEKNGG